MIFTKEDASTSDEQVEVLSKEYNIKYIACVGPLIYLLSKRIDLYFAVHNLETFLSNTGKLHSESWVHLLRYINDNNNFVLKDYFKMEDKPLSYLLNQASIKTKNKLMIFSDSRTQDCPYKGRSTGA